MATDSSSKMGKTASKSKAPAYANDKGGTSEEWMVWGGG